jgi:hypothetical protein
MHISLIRSQIYEMKKIFVAEILMDWLQFLIQICQQNLINEIKVKSSRFQLEQCYKTSTNPAIRTA